MACPHNLTLTAVSLVNLGVYQITLVFMDCAVDCSFVFFLLVSSIPYGTPSCYSIVSLVDALSLCILQQSFIQVVTNLVIIKGLLSQVVIIEILCTIFSYRSSVWPAFSSSPHPQTPLLPAFLYNKQKDTRHMLNAFSHVTLTSKPQSPLQPFPHLPLVLSPSSLCVSVCVSVSIEKEERNMG